MPGRNIYGRDMHGRDIHGRETARAQALRWELWSVRVRMTAEVFAFGLIFTAVSLFTVTKLVYVVRYALFWMYTAVMLMLVAHVDAHPCHVDAHPCHVDDKREAIALHRRLLLALVTLELLTAATYYALRHPLPQLLLWALKRSEDSSYGGAWLLRFCWQLSAISDQATGPEDGSRAAVCYRLRLWQWFDPCCGVTDALVSHETRVSHELYPPRHRKKCALHPRLNY